MKQRIIPAIMSGGAGTRLWPASTEARPKQFHALNGPHSLFAETVTRVTGETPSFSFAPPIVLANTAHAALVREHLAQAGATASAIVLEPAPRNTAAVGAIAAAIATETDPDALVLLLPADHVIADRAAFLDAIAQAAPVAKDRIVTFGITPDRPETGYGYIKSGEELASGVFAIESFREKPNLQTAQSYLDAGGYAWNAGIFLFHPRVMLQEFEASADIRDRALEALAGATRADGEIRIGADAFARVPSQPLDIAVMEKTKRAAVAPCDIGWADIGSWSEIWRLAPKDADGNALQGAIVARDAHNTLLHADGVKLAVQGVSDLVIVATKDAVIVLPRESAQDVKELREAALKKN